ncbi:DUF3341 domain-containing protein [Alloalcanivorax mobilis]|uniref:DUF3341 domain-containing protein n=1 Tax=Alloalcanivorax mobilis TaxID=2019569 RepID=UPI000C762363|nr:DUF3341 domain-containing protein [Alloalcanivorax mobilis]
MSEIRIHGLLARFADTETLLLATRALRGAGYTHLDAYSPHPVQGLSEALAIEDHRVPVIALICAVLAGAATLALQVYASLDYPFNVGGKPVVSWPAYVIVTFAMSMVGATLGALFSMLLLNGFPKPYHPLFNIAEFSDASRDGFFLCLQSSDPRFDARRGRALLEHQGALRVWEVPQ